MAVRRASAPAPMDPVRLALDVGPLHGPPHRRRARRRRSATVARPSVDDVALVPYVRQLPSRRRRCERRLPLPAALAHGCGPSATGRGSIAGSAAPTSSTAPTTSCRRPAARGRLGVRLLVPAPPGAGHAARCAAPARCCAGPSSAARPSHASSAGDRGGDRASCSAPTASRSCHLAPRCRSDRARRAADRSGSTADRSSLRRHARAAQEPARARRRRSASWRRRTTTACWCIAGAPTATTATGDRRGDRRARRRAARRVVCPGRVDDAPRRGCCTTPTVLAYPSLDEGFGFPLLEAQQRRRAGRRQRPPARSPRSAATASSSSTRTTRPPSPTPSTRRARSTTDGSRLLRPRLRATSPRSRGIARATAMAALYRRS